MNSKLSLLLAVGTLALGCGAEVGDEGEVGSISAELTGPTVYFQSYVYQSSNGVGAVERFADCSPDQVLTGMGARVADGNFTDLTVYCRDILSTGLSVNESHFSTGGPSEEKRLNADNGQVVVGMGGIVSGDNVARIVIRQCPWQPATKRVDLTNCTDKSTSAGSFSTEAYLDAHNGYSAAQKPRVVGSGVGMTSTGDNVYAVRMSIGYLK